MEPVSIHIYTLKHTPVHGDMFDVSGRSEPAVIDEHAVSLLKKKSERATKDDWFHVPRPRAPVGNSSGAQASKPPAVLDAGSMNFLSIDDCLTQSLKEDCPQVFDNIKDLMGELEELAAGSDYEAPSGGEGEDEPGNDSDLSSNEESKEDGLSVEQKAAILARRGSVLDLLPKMSESDAAGDRALCTAITESLGIDASGEGWLVKDLLSEPARTVGRLKLTFSDTCIQATCQGVHPNGKQCKLLVSTKGRRAFAEAVCLAWIAAGARVEPYSSEGHQQLAGRLKADVLGVRPARK